MIRASVKIQGRFFKLKSIILGIICLSSCVAALLLAGILPGIFSKSFLAVSIGILAPVPCEDDADCTAGQVCVGAVEGACEGTGDPCFVDDDCPAGETCEGGELGTCTPIPTPTPLLIRAESDLGGFVPRKFILTFDSLLDSAEVTPDSSRLYVNDILHNTVSVIDTSINEVIAITPVGKSPEFTSITPDGKKAYVSNTDDGTLSVIDVVTNRVKQEPIALPDAFRPTIIALTPDGSRAYIATLTETDASNTVSSVSVINVKEDKFLKTIRVGDNPVFFDTNGDIISGDIITSISPTPDSSKVFVSISPQRESVSGSSMLENGEVSIISVQSNKVIGKVGVGPSPNDILITEDGSKAYVLNFGGVLIEQITGIRTDVPGSVFIIDVEKSVTDPENAVIATVADESLLHPVVISGDPERSRIYVGYSGSDDIIDKLIAIETEGKGDSVISRSDLANFITGRGVFPEDNKYGIAIMPDGSKLYLSENIVSENSDNKGLVRSIELNNSNIFGTIRNINIDLEIIGIEVAFEIPETEKTSNLYVIHTDRISVIDISTDSPPFKVIRPRGTGPTDLTLSPDGSILFAVNSGRDTVSIVNVSDDTILDKVNVGKQPIRVAVSPDSKAYVLNFEDNSVSILDGLEVNKIPINCNRFSSSIEKSDPKKSGPVDISVSPDSSDIYVICFSPGGEGQGAIINFSSQVVGTLKLADASVSIDIPKDSGRVYVVNGDISEIRVFNTVNPGD